MRNIYLCAAIALILCVGARKEKAFMIRGYIAGIADSTQLMLSNLSSGEDIDSAVVIKGRFTFKGKLQDSPEELRIISGAKEMMKGQLFYTDLLMGNEIVEVQGDVSDMPLNITTRGSIILKDAEIFHKQLFVWNEKVRQLQADLKSIPDSGHQNEKKVAVEKIKIMKDSVDKWNIQFIKENFNSYIALVMYNYRRDFPVDTLKKLFKGLSTELKQSKYGKSISFQIDFPKPRVGDTFHNFEAITQRGTPTKLSAITNKYVLLQFAGTGCYWSHMSMPEIRKLSREYKDSISFVSYFMDDKASWLNTVKTDSIDWESLWSKGFKYSEACSKYSVTGTPTFFLISPDKKIVATWFGYEKGIVEKEIKMALQK